MRSMRFALLLSLALLGACSTQRARPVAAPHYTPAAHPGAAQPNDILMRALGLVGTPYRWGGNTPQSGFDCSGLVVFVFREIAGVGLPRTVPDIYAANLASVKRDKLQGGDLVFFDTGSSRGTSHVGIYVGEQRFVHAPNQGGTVRLDYLTNPYWASHYAGARRVPL